jgi:hypothetical protein
MRIELGPRDVKNRSVVISRRDVPGKQGKEFGVSMEPSTLVDHIKGRLEEIQASLLQKAIEFRDRYSYVQFSAFCIHVPPFLHRRVHFLMLKA